MNCKGLFAIIGGVVILAFGILSIIIYSTVITVCSNYTISISQYILGSGISYLIISLAYLVAGFLISFLKVDAQMALSHVTIITMIFSIIWIFIGIITFTSRHGFCSTAIYPVWAMGIADISCSVFLFFFSLFSFITVYRCM